MLSRLATHLRVACRRPSAWIPALCVGIAASSAGAAVPVGSWCVTGSGAAGGADGWIDVVDPDTGTAAAVVLSQPLVDPYDCAVDPTTGDVIVVDQGAAAPAGGPPGAVADGALYRVLYDPGTQQGTVIPLVTPSVPAPQLWDGGNLGPAAPLMNPRGVAVGPDGTIFVADVGGNLAANDGDGAIYALTFSGGAVDTLYRRAVGASADSPVDVDLDPRPWDVGGTPALFLVYVEYSGQLRRVQAAPTASQAVTDIGATPGGVGWNGLEVGAYGNYWITRAPGGIFSNSTLERYERRTGTRTTVYNLFFALFQGVTVDHTSGDLVVVSNPSFVFGTPSLRTVAPSFLQNGIVNIAQSPARANPRGIGYSPPRATGAPSANLAMPTRLAPVPAGGIVIAGPGLASADGEPEREIDVFVEVTGDRLVARFFDVDSQGAYDADRNGAFDSPVEVTLYAPDNTTILARETIAAGGRGDLDERVATLTCAAPPCIGTPLVVRGAGVDLSGTGPGLYRLQVRMTGADDMNVLGLWVEDYHAYTYSVPVGPVTTLAGVPPSGWSLDGLRVYPHFERGCEYVFSEFDGDSNASYELRTRLDRVLPVAGVSANDQHAETLVDPVAPRSAVWTISDSLCAGTNCALDYGVQTLSAQLVPSTTVNNVVGLRAADFNGYEDAGGSNAPVPVPRGEPAPPAAPPPDTPAFRTSPLGYNQEASFGSGGGNNFLRFFLPRYEERPNPLAPMDPAGAALPYAPYLMQSATQLSESTPPTPPPGPPAGSTTRFLMNVTVVNPDPANAMNDVDLTVPIPDGAGSGLAYTTALGTGVVCDFGAPGCNVPASGPGALTTPLNGGPPSVITLRFTQIPPASSATLSYAVDVTPTAVGATVYLSEGPRYRNSGALPTFSGTTATFPANPAPPLAAPLTTDMGTRAVYTAAWGRSESLGPLCDVYVVEGTVVPNAVDLARFEALAQDAAVLVRWETAAEFDNLGFHLYRRLDGEAEFSRLNDGLILGRGTSDLSGRYAVLDLTVPNGVRAEYLLEDVETDGTTTLHGPVDATPRRSAEPYAFDAGGLHAFRVVDSPGAWEEGAAEEAPPPPPAGEESSDSSGAGLFRVISRDARSALLEIVVPEIELTAFTRAGERWTRVRAEGYEPSVAPGRPELPVRTFWLEAADTTGVDLHLLEHDAGERILSAPVFPVGGIADPEVYASSTPQPAAPVELAGSVRLPSGERLLALRVQPARYVASTRTLATSRRLRVRVDLQGPLPLPEAAADALAANRASVAAQPGAKLVVRGPGLARILGAELLAAGIPADADPRHLHVFLDGVEIDVRLEGEADGVLDPGDALLLWAPAVDTRYGDEAVFFVIAGDTPGRRVQTEDTRAEGPALATLPARSRVEPQELYLPTVRNGEGDNFVGPYVYDAPVALDVPTPAAVTGDASLRVRLRGGTSFPGVGPDHHFGIRAGGAPAIDALFDGTELFEAVAVLPQSALGDEALRVEVVPRFDAAVPQLDLVYVDAFELAYRRAPRLVAADGGRLAFTADRDGVVAIDVVDPGARVWDVTDAAAPRALRVASGDGALRFAVGVGRSYALAEESGLLAPSRLRAHAPSDWSRGAHGADWIAIARADLLPEARRLARHREDQGLATAVVDVEDVYDETGGAATPLALREFLRAIVHRWDPAPRYVVLVGDATYDYRDFLGGRAENGVPTLLVDTTFVEAASDSALVSFDDVPDPELAVGRLPARTPRELAAMVDKIVAYEDALALGAGGDWRERVLLVADDGAGDGDAAEASVFEATLADFGASLPSGLRAQALRLREVPEGPQQGEAAHAVVESALEEGVALAFYSGHGGARVWADELILDADDVARIALGPRQPVVVALNCLNGFFDAPNEESLSEIAVREPEGGAIAYISSTTVSALPGQRSFARALASRLGRTGSERVGEALRQAEREIAGEPGADDVLRSWVLIGDPALRLPLGADATHAPTGSDAGETPTPAGNDGGAGSLGCGSSSGSPGARLSGFDALYLLLPLLWRGASRRRARRRTPDLPASFR